MPKYTFDHDINYPQQDSECYKNIPLCSIWGYVIHLAMIPHCSVEYSEFITGIRTAEGTQNPTSDVYESLLTFSLGQLVQQTHYIRNGSSVP